MKSPQYTPLFQDWVHSTTTIFGEVTDYPPSEKKFIRRTSTLSCYNAIFIQQSNNTMNSGAPTSFVHFWEDISNEGGISKLQGAIKRQFQSIFPNLSVFSRLNPSKSWLFHYLSTAKKRSCEKRVLIHYYSYGIPPTSGQLVSFISPDGKRFESESIKNIIEYSLPTSAFIFDCDCSGAFLSEFEKLGDEDVFAFFSCARNEVLPKVSGMPADLFTSCLISPARMALLWHSRHYFCFDEGPLRSLDLFFPEKENDDQIKEIFNNITILLKCLVEAAAYLTMERPLFVRLFRTDSIVAQLSVNFILACRIFSSLNQHPVSYPSFPSLNNSNLWNNFDMRLDAELFNLRLPWSSIRISFSSYLRQVLTSIQTAIEVSESSDFFPEVCFFNPLLKNSETAHDVLPLLSKFLDKSHQAIFSALQFQIFVPLYKLLLDKTQSLHLLFCLFKFVCYDPSVKDFYFNGKNVEIFNSNLLLFLQVKIPTIPLIFLVQYVHGSQFNLNLLVKSKWISYVLPLLFHHHTDVKIWSLLLLKQGLNQIEDTTLKSNIFEKIKQIDHKNFIELKLVIIYVLADFLFDSCLVDNALQFIFSFAFLNPLIDCEIISALSYLYSFNSDISKQTDFHIRSVIAQFQRSLYATTKSYAVDLIRSLEKKPVTIMHSKLYQSFCSLILKPILFILEDPEREISSYTQIKYTKIKSSRESGMNLRSFKLSPAHSYNYQITSNFTRLPKNLIAFGDSNGLIYIKSFLDQQPQKLFHASSHGISGLQYFKNSGHPLVFASDFSGSFLVYNYENFDEYIYQFKVDQTAIQFDVDEFKSRIYYYKKSTAEPINIFDLRKECTLVEISLNQMIFSVRSLSDELDLFGICSENLLLFDIRSNKVVSKIDTIVPPIDFKLCSDLNYYVCLKNTSVSYVDLRNPQIVGQRFTFPELPESECLSFDIHPKSRAFCLGHSNGVSILDSHTGKSQSFIHYPRFIGKKQRIGSVSNVLFSRTNHFLNVQNSPNSILLISEV